MSKYRKKPVVIKAVQFTGKNAKKIAKWMKSGNAPVGNETFLTIYTLEGQMDAMVNDWIIKGVKGEFYPCKPDIFEATYEVIK